MIYRGHAVVMEIENHLLLRRDIERMGILFGAAGADSVFGDAGGDAILGDPGAIISTAAPASTC